MEEGATSWCGILLGKYATCHPPSLPLPSHPTFGTAEQRNGSTDSKGHSIPVPVQQFGMGLLIYSTSATDPTWRQKQRAAISIVPAALLSLCKVNRSCLVGCAASKNQGQTKVPFHPLHQCTTANVHFESLKMSITCFIFYIPIYTKMLSKCQKLWGATNL